MTQTLPDLVRPTRWRLHLRTAWGAPAIHEVEGAYLDDALRLAADFDRVNLERVVMAEFLRLDADEWQSVPQPPLKEAIDLVTRI